ncbi:MAG: hypothetical protein ABID63_02440 [Pseudomonadota bacterium]
MALNNIGRTSQTGPVSEQQTRTERGRAGGEVRSRVSANSEMPSADFDIRAQLARLRNLIDSDQIDHTARRGTYLNILL